jgi:hypothetical protein
VEHAQHLLLALLLQGCLALGLLILLLPLLLLEQVPVVKLVQVQLAPVHNSCCCCCQQLAQH